MRRQIRFLLPVLAAMALVLPAAAATTTATRDTGSFFQDFHFTGTLGLDYTNGSYGTARNTDVELAMPALSVETGALKLSISMPYMRISGRGLVVFDAAGNPVVINRNTAAPPDVRTGWGDPNISASYTLPADWTMDFDVRLTALMKVSVRSERRRLATGKNDYGASIDVSHKYGDWEPFLTVGYLVPGQPTNFQLYDTTSVSAGTSYVINDSLVAVGSYDFDSASTPLVPASHELFGSLSWIRDDNLTLTGYTTAGLSSGSPSFGAGVLISYGFN